MKFCIVYPYARWLLRTKPCGGAEKQVGLLAQHLVRRGNEVTFVALDYRGHEREIDGVRVRPAWDVGRGTPWLRAATYRLPSLKRLMAEIDADVYCVRGAQTVSRWVIAAAHTQGAPALLGLASDRNLLPESGQTMIPMSNRHVGGVIGRLAWHLLQRPALHMADAVIVQNDEQASRCSRMGLPHVLIPSIVEAPPGELLEREADYDVIWVGNVHTDARGGKGVDALSHLALALPGLRFAVVGALTQARVAVDFDRLSAAPNVDVLGYFDYGETQSLIARSRLVLNTSSVEGFSNVMLEGWALGKPAITLTVNPSGLLAAGRWPSLGSREHRYKGALGACAGGDIRLLSRLIGTALGDAAMLREVGRLSREYVAEVHGADAVCARYEDLAALPRFISRHEVPKQ
jgi:glycosyltransferase involved in cell wall biosynthesis